MLLFPAFSIALLLSLLFLLQKKQYIIYHPVFSFFLYSHCYIVGGGLSLLFEPHIYLAKYLPDVIINQDLLLIYSFLLALILWSWLFFSDNIILHSLQSSSSLPHYIDYLLLLPMLFVPHIFKEPIAIFVSINSSLVFFDALKEKHKLLPVKFTILVISIFPLLFTAVVNSTSKRVSVYPFFIALALIHLFKPRITNSPLSHRFTSRSVLKKLNSYMISTSILLLAVLLIPVLQILRGGSTFYVFEYLPYFFSAPNLFKLLEFSTLYIHSLNFWNLINLGDIDPTIFSPTLKLFGIGHLPFTGDRILSFNDTYTGYVDPVYRLIGGSNPTLKWISSLGFFPFPLNIIYPLLNLLILSFFFKLLIKSFNLLPFYIAFPYFAITYARGADISLVMFELTLTCSICIFSFLFAKILSCLLPRSYGL